MIRKVLIAEDHQSANISIQRTLEQMDVRDIDYVYYCDDALSKIKTQQKNGKSYDLLITDLSFEQDYRAVRISGGAALIAAAPPEILTAR
ncbi:MAG: response regulator [Chitinophagaceae bacterium]|nr:MAG: response regulator [Chitinophagaceae bacterium]